MAKNIEVHPLYVSDHVLDLINSGMIVKRKYPDGWQSLIIPSTFNTDYFHPEKSKLLTHK
jgi:hypothetical protein